MPSDGDYSYSCLMAVVPEIIGHRVLSWARENIAKEDLHDNGFEDEPHVTILYGLHTADADRIFGRVGDRKPLQAKMKGLSLFSNDKYDVLKIGIESSDLAEINKMLRSKESYTNAYDDYQPHCTVCYLKKGRGKKYLEKDVFKNETFWMQMLDFSDKDGNHTFKRLVDPIYKQAFLDGYFHR